MKGIRGCIWIVEEADEAVELYTSLFEDAEVGDRLTYGEAGREIHGHEPGSTMTIDFSLAGRKFLALRGGPQNELNPSLSVVVDCPSAAEVDRLWEALSDGGETLMELGSHAWAPRYGWLQDRFGLSWQLSWAGEDAAPEKVVTPCFLFAGEVYRRGREALDFYTSVFDGSSVDTLVPNPEGDPAGTVMWSEFTLAGERFRLMESGLDHDFQFNDAFSLMVECESQAEIDRYWEALTDAGRPGPCGWLRDRFGVAWQVAPVALMEMLRDGDPEQVARVTDCFMQMKKLDLPQIEAAYRA